jgi:RimJ/RimL family protein N-acetyltransferase
MAGTIWGEKIGIRRLRPSDAPALRRMMLDPEVADLLFEEMGGPLPSPFAMAVGILSNLLANRPEWGIVTLQGRFIGEVRLWRVSEANRSAMLTIFIGDHACWGRGYGTEAINLLLLEAFNRMNLHRVELHVFGFNVRAIRSYEKVGFIVEGTRREALARGGRKHDIVIMGILRDEFLSRAVGRPGAPLLRQL